jgi:hypothetical protein
MSTSAEQLDNNRDSIRRTGAVYTPSTVADALVDYVRPILNGRGVSVLEPSVGDGVFVDSIEGRIGVDSLTVVDVSKVAVKAVAPKLAVREGKSASIIKDFVSYASDEIERGRCDFDLVIGNPPFIRRHNFSLNFKRSVSRLARVTKYPLSGLKNSWAAFVVGSLQMLRSDGVLAFVLPYELITVKYGKDLLAYLRGECARVDIFVSNKKAFDAIDQDALLLVLQKGSVDEPGMFMRRVESFENLSVASVHRLDLDGGAKSCSDSLVMNSHIIGSGEIKTILALRERLEDVSHHCSSSPGVVTAANEYFILSEQEANRMKLAEYGLPILRRSGPWTNSPLFDQRRFDQAAAVVGSRLISLSSPKKQLSVNAKLYVERGEEDGINHRYKCRHRDPWYKVPLVPVAEGFVFRRAHLYPRLCVNEAASLITDNAYGISPKAGFSMRGICYSFYNSLTLLYAEIAGRFYGGGVLELSPKEFRSLPLPYVEPTAEEFRQFVRVTEADAGEGLSILDFGDAWLSREYGFAMDDLAIARNAWLSVRAHRLRHGRAGKLD